MPNIIYAIFAVDLDNGSTYCWDKKTKTFCGNFKYITFFQGGIEAKDWEDLYVQFEVAKQVAVAVGLKNVYIGSYKLNPQGDLTYDVLKELTGK